MPLANKDLIFFGNSVVRRQMYTILDILAGPSAHRQLTNFTDIQLPSSDERAVARSWVWDQDNMTRGYHASQMFTVDLATGEHRFSMPHAQYCGLGDTHSVFSPGRLHQWRQPGSGGGSEEITGHWQSSKWAGREWKPLISFRLHTDVHEGLSAQASRRAAMQSGAAGTCAPRQLAWAGSFPGGVDYAPPANGAIKGAASVADSSAGGGGGRRRGSRGRAMAAAELGARLRARLLREVDAFFASHPSMASPNVKEWIGNVTVHYEEDHAGYLAAAGGARAAAAAAAAGCGDGGGRWRRRPWPERVALLPHVPRRARKVQRLLRRQACGRASRVRQVHQRASHVPQASRVPQQARVPADRSGLVGLRRAGACVCGDATVQGPPPRPPNLRPPPHSLLR